MFCHMQIWDTNTNKNSRQRTGLRLLSIHPWRESQPGVRLLGDEQAGTGMVCPALDESAVCELGECDCTYGSWTTWTVHA